MMTSARSLAAWCGRRDGDGGRKEPELPVGGGHGSLEELLQELPSGRRSVVHLPVGGVRSSAARQAWSDLVERGNAGEGLPFEELERRAAAGRRVILSSSPAETAPAESRRYDRHCPLAGRAAIARAIALCHDRRRRLETPIGPFHPGSRRFDQRGEVTLGRRIDVVDRSGARGSVAWRREPRRP